MAHLPWFLIYYGTEAHFITLMTQVLYKHHLGSHSFPCLVVVEKQCFPSISQNIFKHCRQLTLSTVMLLFDVEKLLCALEKENNSK